MSDQVLKDVKKDIYLMIHKADAMLQFTEDALTNSRLSALDEAREIAREMKVKKDLLSEKLAKAASVDKDALAILTVPVLIEKVGASIERVMDNLRVKIQEGILFSDKAILESGRMIAKSREVLKKAGEALVTGSAAAAETVRKESDAMIKMAADFATAHEERLVAGECSPKSSSTYLSMLYAFGDLAARTRDVLAKITGK